MKKKMDSSSSDKRELWILIAYAIAFYSFVIHRSLRLSTDYHSQLYGLRSASASAWLSKFIHRSNDVSDAQWRNFRANLPILTNVFAIFGLAANAFRLSKSQSQGNVFPLAFPFFHLPYLSARSLHCVHLSNRFA